MLAVVLKSECSAASHSVHPTLQSCKLLLGVVCDVVTNSFADNCTVVDIQAFVNMLRKRHAHGSQTLL
jgi:hypothetical protein